MGLNILKTEWENRRKPGKRKENGIMVKRQLCA